MESPFYILVAIILGCENGFSLRNSLSVMVLMNDLELPTSPIVPETWINLKLTLISQRKPAQAYVNGTFSRFLPFANPATLPIPSRIVACF